MVRGIKLVAATYAQGCNYLKEITEYFLYAASLITNNSLPCVDIHPGNITTKIIKKSFPHQFQFQILPSNFYAAFNNPFTRLHIWVEGETHTRNLNEIKNGYQVVKVYINYLFKIQCVQVGNYKYEIKNYLRKPAFEFWPLTNTVVKSDQQLSTCKEQRKEFISFSHVLKRP